MHAKPCPAVIPITSIPEIRENAGENVVNTVFRVVLAMVLAVCIGANPVDSKSAPPGGRFILQDHTGAFVTDQHFRGRFMLVTFGYTFCPDICPTNLINMTEALDQLESDSGKIAAIFITVDPERDTVRQLNGYMTAFHPDMVGLTGSEEMVDRIAAGYKVIYERHEPDAGDEPDEYAVDHTASIFLMGPDGKFLVKFAHGMAPDAMASRIREFF